MYLKRKLEKNPATNMTLKFVSEWDKVLNFDLETTVKANCFTIMLKYIFWSCFYDSVWFLNSQDKKNGPKRNAQFHFAYNTEILLGKVIVLFISATGDEKDLALWSWGGWGSKLVWLDWICYRF